MTDHSQGTPGCFADAEGSITAQLGLDPAVIRVFDFASGPDEPPKCRIYCPQCTRRFYTKAGRGEVATCYHFGRRVKSTGAKNQDPGRTRKLPAAELARLAARHPQGERS
jgi:hypothetical protein